MTPLRLALLNVSRKRVSSLIAVVAVAISVGCAGVLLRLYQLSGSRFASLARGPDAIVGAKSGGIEILLGALNLEGAYPGYLPMRLYESLIAQRAVRFEDGSAAKPDYLRDVIPFLYVGRVGSEPGIEGSTRVIATSDHFLSAPDDPKPIAQGRWAAGTGEAVAGAAAARRLGLSPGRKIEARIWTADMPDTASSAIATSLVVVGVLAPLESAWDRGIFVNLETGRAALASRGPLGNSIWGADVLNYFLVYLKQNGMKPLLDLVNKRTVGQVVSVAAERDELDRLTGSGRSLGLIVTSLIIALAGLCMLTLMLVRFDAMALQIAVLRAIGYLRREIALWLLYEGACLGLAGCAIGAVADAALFPIFRRLLGEALPSPEIASSSALQSWPIWLAALLAVTASLLLPIARMWKQDVATSLKG